MNQAHCMWYPGDSEIHHTLKLNCRREERGFLWPRMKTLLDFCLSRRNGDGFAVGLENDWVFIDWADLDKERAVPL